MIYFEHSGYLYWVGLLPALLIMWLLNRRRQFKLSALLGEKKLVKNLTITSPMYVQVLKYTLFLLAMLLLIIALAQPILTGSDEQTKRLMPADVVFVVDVSKSMYVKDMAPDRLSRARHIIKQIIQQLNNEQVGIVLFAGKANTYVPLTGDYFYVNKAVDAITGNLIKQQGTSLREALKIAALIYGPDNKKVKVMCLLSDGEFHDHNALGLSDSIRKTGIQLFTFGFGTASGGEVPLNDQPDNEAVEKDINGKPIISHLNKNELLKIAGNRANNYMEIADKLTAASLFTNKLRVMEYSDVSGSPKQYYNLFLLGAIILLIAEVCIPQVLKTHK
jgi:Ca-activated chloride channel family protein